MAEEFVMNEEVVENAAEEIVTKNSKLSLGKLALGGAVIGGVVVGITKLIKYVKGKIAAKKSPVVTEPKNWVEELHEIAEEPIDDLAE